MSLCCGCRFHLQKQRYEIRGSMVPRHRSLPASQHLPWLPRVVWHCTPFLGTHAHTCDKTIMGRDVKRQNPNSSNSTVKSEQGGSEQSLCSAFKMPLLATQTQGKVSISIFLDASSGSHWAFQKKPSLWMFIWSTHDRPESNTWVLQGVDYGVLVTTRLNHLWTRSEHPQEA